MENLKPTPFFSNKKNTRIINSVLAVLILLYTQTNCYAQRTARPSKIQVPYFGAMTATEICGRPDCQPQSCPNWAYIAGGLPYEEAPETILGRWYDETVFKTKPCANKPTLKDLAPIKKKTLNGRVESNKKKEFDTKISSDLAKAVNETIELPESVKADLLAQIEKTVANKTNQNIELEYQELSLNTNYKDNSLDACLSQIPKRSYLICAVGLITIKGNWSSETLQDALKNFEANAAAFKALSAESKAKYEQSKSRTLNGTYETFSIIISHAYIYKRS